MSLPTSMGVGAMLRRNLDRSQRDVCLSNRYKTCTQKNRSGHQLNLGVDLGRSTHTRDAFEAWQNLRSLGR
ncbi:hypothetical protein D3C87_527440 [compost metagenome]